MHVSRLHRTVTDRLIGLVGSYVRFFWRVTLTDRNIPLTSRPRDGSYVPSHPDGGRQTSQSVPLVECQEDRRWRPEPICINVGNFSLLPFVGSRGEWYICPTGDLPSYLYKYKTSPLLTVFRRPSEITTDPVTGRSSPPRTQEDP